MQKQIGNTTVISKEQVNAPKSVANEMTVVAGIT